MGLSTSGRTICEDCGVVSIKNTIKERACCRFIHLSLGGILVKDTVEGECLVFNAFAVGDDTFRELLYRAVFRRIEDSEGNRSIIVRNGDIFALHSQAPIIDNLDN